MLGRPGNMLVPVWNYRGRLLPDGIDNRVAVALAHLVASYGVGYVVAIAIAHFVIAYGVSDAVTIAVTYLIAAYGIGYIVAITIADFVAADGVHYFIAIAPANLLGICSTATARTNVGRLTGAEQYGYEYE